MRLICLVLTLCFAAPLAAKEVRTHRSDGTVFPAVKQEGRKQSPKRVKISASTQALPAKGAWQDLVEPVDGGIRVAPAGTVAQGDVAVLVEVPASPNERDTYRPQRRKNKP